MASIKKSKPLKIKNNTKRNKKNKDKRKTKKRISFKKMSAGNLKKSNPKYDTYYNLLMQNRNISDESDTQTKEKEDKKNNKICIVLVFAEWCGHCQALRPTWDDMVEQLDDNKYDVVEINSDNQEEGIQSLKNKYEVDDIDVSGYPTIGSIKNKKFTNYNGGRNIKDLLKWTKTLMKN
jgi:thiol-disulfide isomerase/thioredoxin